MITFVIYILSISKFYLARSMYIFHDMNPNCNFFHMFIAQTL